MSTKNEQKMALIGLVALMCMMPMSIFYFGFVFMRLWEWFIIPTFAQAPALTITRAIGVTIVIRFATFQFSPSYEKKGDVGDIISKEAGKMFMYPVLVLGIGYIVSQFM